MAPPRYEDYDWNADQEFQRRLRANRPEYRLPEEPPQPDWSLWGSTPQDRREAIEMKSRFDKIDRLRAADRAQRKAEQDARDQARYDEAMAKYEDYIKGRGGKEPIGLQDNTRWVNDAGAYKGGGEYAAPTPGKAWEDWRNMGRGPSVIAKGTEFEQNIPGFRQLGGAYSRSPGNWRIAEDARSMFNKPDTEEPPDYVLDHGELPFPVGNLKWPAEAFDPANYKLYTKSPLDLLNEGLSPIGVKAPSPSFAQASSAGPIGIAAYEAMNQPLDPRLLALQALGLRGIGGATGKTVRSLGRFLPPGRSTPLLPRGPQGLLPQGPYTFPPKTVNLSYAGTDTLPIPYNANPGELEYIIRSRDALRKLIEAGATANIGKGWVRGSY